MVLTITESTRYNTNNFLGEIINKFQDYNIKKNIRTHEIKNKISQIRFYIIKPV